jgi:uncharacterized MAPEG superfamily protein
MSLNSDYGAALTMGAACLAIKITVVHLLTARSRLMTGAFAQPQDKTNAIDPLLKVSLVCVGPDFGVDFCPRSERIAKNCAENEPFFLVLATVAGLSGSVPAALGVTLIKTYTAARCAHTVVYLCGDRINSAVRSTMFVVGAFATLSLGALALGFKMGSK